MKREFLSNTKNNTVKETNNVQTMADKINFNQSYMENELINHAKATLPIATKVKGIYV